MVHLSFIISPQHMSHLPRLAARVPLASAGRETGRGSVSSVRHANSAGVQQQGQHWTLVTSVQQPAVPAVHCCCC